MLKIWKIKINLRIIMIIYSVIAIALPFVLHGVYHKMSWDNWYSMLLGYSGGAIGGIATLIAIYISTDQTRAIQEENREKEIKPIADFTCKSSGVFTFKVTEDGMYLDGIPNLEFNIFNLSQYPAKQFKIVITLDWEDFINISQKNGIELQYRDNTKQYLILKENSKCMDQCFTFGEKQYKIEKFERYIFKDKNINISFSRELIQYGSFFSSLVLEYIKKYIKKYKFISNMCNPNEEIIRFKIEVSYNDIENSMKKYKKKYCAMVNIFIVSIIDKEISSINLKKVSKFEDWDTVNVILKYTLNEITHKCEE